MAGRCVPEKGFDIFLESSERVRAVPPFSAHVWGVQQLKNNHDYFDAIDRGIEEVKAKPYCHASMRSHFGLILKISTQTTDVVVIPRRFAEPLGRVAIEAMAAGCVVVAANHGGLAEIIDDGVNGLLFEPGNARRLASKIQFLLNNPHHLRPLSERGREIALTRYSPNRHAQTVQQVYRQLVGP